MALFNVKGSANYDGVSQKRFDVVVESDPQDFNLGSSYKIKAIKAKYPHWDAINVDSWKQL